jgi:hypothetical protein
MITNEHETFNSAFCDEYEQLLGRCQRALDGWATRREEVSQMGLSGKEIGAELVKLQAEFAKAYAILQRHTRDCPLCQFVAKIASHDAQSPYLVASNSQPA